MAEQDFSQRIVIVVRGDLEPWQQANTIGHIGAYLGNQLGRDFATGELFTTKDNVALPRNSQYPVIIKRAKSNEQLANLVKKVRDTKLSHHAFIREMIDFTDDEDLQIALSAKEEENVEYLGIGVFGPNDDVNTLTKKFGLW